MIFLQVSDSCMLQINSVSELFAGIKGLWCVSEKYQDIFLLLQIQNAWTNLKIFGRCVTEKLSSEWKQA